MSEKKKYIRWGLSIGGAVVAGTVAVYHVSEFIHKWRTDALELKDVLGAIGVVVLLVGILVVIGWWRAHQPAPPAIPNPPDPAGFAEALLGAPLYCGTYLGLGACLIGRVHGVICLRDALNSLRTMLDTLHVEARKATLRDKPSVYRLRAAVSDALSMLALFNHLSIWRIIEMLPECTAFVEFLTGFDKTLQGSNDALHRLINRYERHGGNQPNSTEVQQCINDLRVGIEELKQAYPKNLDQCVTAEKQRLERYFTELRLLQRRIPY